MSLVFGSKVSMDLIASDGERSLQRVGHGRGHRLGIDRAVLGRQTNEQSKTDDRKWTIVDHCLMIDRDGMVSVYIVVRPPDETIMPFHIAKHTNESSMSIRSLTMYSSINIDRARKPMDLFLHYQAE